MHAVARVPGVLGSERDAAGRLVLRPAAGSGATPHHLELTLDVSKTDQQRAGSIKVISAPTAMWAHCCCGQSASGDQPLFEMGGRQLTANAVIVRLRRELVAIGRGDLAGRITARSFRRGGASALSGIGATDADIARLGWAPSSTVGRTIYANDPRVQRARALAINAQMESAARGGSII